MLILYFYFLYNCFILATASIVFSLVLNAVNLKYPSPCGPNPLPGVPTTFTSSSNLSKNSQDVIPSGTFSHIYGEFTPPYTLNPDSSKPFL